MKVEQKELPPGWQWTTMGEIAEVVGGGTPKTSDSSNYESGTIPWLTPADLSGYTGKTIGHGARYITQKGLDTSSAKMMPAGAVLFTSRAPIGYVAIASNPVCTNQGFKSFVLKDGVLPDYVYWWLKGSKNLAESMASGTTFLELSGAKAKQLPIPVAPLDQQKRIVAEIEKQFSRLDEVVANLKRVKANLKRYKAAVLKAAVEGRLVETEAGLARREGRSYETGAQLLQRILETRRSQWQGKGKYKEPAAPDTTNLPELPEGWVWASADQLMSLITDGEHITPLRSESGVLLLSARNVLNGQLDLSVVDYVPEEEHLRLSQRFSVMAGDVLLSCSGSVGRSCVVPNGAKFSLVRSVAVLRPVVIPANFVCYQIQSPLLQSQIATRKTQTAQANIFQGKIRQLVFALPPEVEQQRIVAEVDRRLSLLRETEAQVDANLLRAECLRQSILMKAFKAPRIEHAMEIAA